MPETIPPTAGNPLEILHQSCSETSHSPSLVDLLGEEAARSIVDFCFLANPYYPTPAMIQHLQDALPTLIKSYPSSTLRRSEEHLAAALHVDPDHLVIGNGAPQLIAILCELLVGNIGIPFPTCGEYIGTLRDMGVAGYFRLNPRREYHLDPVEYAEWLRRNGLRAALVVNPGDPTGQLLSLQEMLWLLGATRDLEMVVIDESVVDFAGEEIPSLLPHVEEFPNLLVVRSMGKHHGAPGLGLGYGCTANPGLRARLRKAIPIGNIGTLAEHYLSLLLETQADYHAARLRVIGDVRGLRHDLSALSGFHTYPTGANFILVRIDLPMSAGELQLRLLRESRIHVRRLASEDGMDDRHIRIASQGRETDLLLIEALRTISREHGK